jgi:cysteine synthase A
MKTVFSGENGVFEYLNPSSHCTPLVELPSTLNPYRKDGVRIFAKLVSHLPLMNIKSIPMFHALNNTSIEGTHTLVENSSGNTAYSLTVLAKLF